MKQYDHPSGPNDRIPAQDAGEKRSGEGAASALARLRMQERAKAAERGARTKPELF